MKKVHTMKIVAAAIAVSLGTVAAASATEVTVGADVSSAYVWRGITFNDGFVVQPSVDVAGPAGLGFEVWGNFDLESVYGRFTDEEGFTTKVKELESGEFSEINLALSYDIPVDGFDLSVGLIEYLFPAGDASTREVYAEVGFDLGHGFELGGFVAYDFNEVEDFYASLSLGYEYEVDENLSLGIEGVIGAGGKDATAGGESGLHEWMVTVSGAYALNGSTELGAFLAYTDSLDSKALPSQKVDFFGGVSLYYSF